MPSLLDSLGGLIKQGENAVGSFLQGMNPSQPAKPNNPPLPSPEASATMPSPAPPLGGAPPRQQDYGKNFNLLVTNPGQFSKNVGLDTLFKTTSMPGTGMPIITPNFDSAMPQIEDPNSQVNQLGQQVQKNPISEGAKYVANVLNAGVTDPIRLAADPQMWFADDNNAKASLGAPGGGFDNMFGNGPGHNYLRDAFAPTVKSLTGEDVPDTMYHFQQQAESLTDQANKLESMQGQLTANSSQVDIDAYNAKLTEFNSRMQKYQSDYQRSQDWWNNSNISKAMSILGQIATFPAGFAAGAATFVPTLIADPIGSGEGIISQVHQATDFMGKLMDPEARSHMSAQELSANLSNVAMLAGMLYGGKGAVEGTGKAVSGIRDTFLGRKADPAALDKLKQDLHEYTPEFRNPEAGEDISNPPLVPSNPKMTTDAELQARKNDARMLQENIVRTTDPNERAVLQKQLNDITDAPKAASEPSEGPIPIEDMDPKTIRSMAQNAGYVPTTPDKVEGSAWISPTGDAFGLPEGELHSDFAAAVTREGSWPETKDISDLHRMENMSDKFMQNGWIKVTNLAGIKGYAVDMLDPENVKTIEEAIVGDILREPKGLNATRQMPYQVVETSTNRAYQITKEELAANNFNLARAIAQQKRIMPRSQPNEGPPITEIKPDQLTQAVKDTGWKLVPSSKVQYGWLFPNGKGAELGLTESRGVHSDLELGVARTLGRALLSPNEWHEIKKDWVELRRGFGPDINDHYFYAETWTPKTLGIVENYLLDKQSERPAYVMLESRNSVKVAGRATFDSVFTWDEFKNNDFKLDGLMGRRSPVYSATGNEEMGPWLHDKFTELTKARNQINFFENRIAEYQSAGKNTHKDNAQLQKTFEQVQKTLAELPKEVSPQLAKIRDELQGVLNEKGYTATNETGTVGEAGASSEGYNQAPPGAPKGSTLASVIPGPEGKGPIAIWTPDAESTRALSHRERGSLELRQTLRKYFTSLSTDYGEAADITKLEQHPINFERRSKELINVFKTHAENLDPIGVAQLRHFVIDPDLASDALFDPNTGVISINPYKSALTTWARSAAGSMQKGFNEVKSYIPDEGAAAAYKWIEDTKNLTQDQLDFRAIAEEILHKYDVDHFNVSQYFEALSRLPWSWWGHARRSGLGDTIEGGLTAKRFDQPGEFTLKTKDGQVVNSWLDAYYAAKNDLLDNDSLIATYTTFVEYRVTQLMNYHGIPGSLFNYRVPEVMYRELENPSLIDEGAKIAGDDFERYVEAETAHRLSLQKVYEERTQANVGSTGSGIPTDASASTSPAVPTSTPTGFSGLDAGNQTSIKLYHGTTNKALNDIKKYGLKPDNLHRTINDIEVSLGLDKDSLWGQKFISTYREGETKVFFAGHPERAAAYAKRFGEAIDEALRAAYRLTHTQHRFVSDNEPAMLKWKAEVADQLGISPVVAEFEFPSQEVADKLYKGNLQAMLDDNLSQNEVNLGLPGEVSPDKLRRTVTADKASELLDGRKPDEMMQGYPSPFDYQKRQPTLESRPSTGPEGIPNSIGAKFEYKPLLELGKTGYPGQWEDFLASLSQPEDSIAYRTARPYFDKMDPRWQESWLEAAQKPGVESAMLNRAASPRVEEPRASETNSPAFLARQEKIKEYQRDIEASGPVLDRLQKSIGNSEGLKKYNQTKALVAAKRKYVSLAPGVPEKEAIQLAGQEFTKTMNALHKGSTGNPVPEDVRFSKNTAELINQIQPVMRNYLQSKVVFKTPEGKVPEGSFPSLERFVDAFAAGEDAAKNLYKTLPKLSKDAIRSLVNQMPQSYKLPGRERLDQTSIPQSQQASQEFINPKSEEELKSIINVAPKVMIRAGSTEYNERGWIRSHDNPTLSSLGRLQARNIARAFKDKRNLKIVTHDLERAYETAASIAKAAKGSKVTVDPNLRPWNLGQELAGTNASSSRQQIEKMMFDEPDTAPEGGESFNQFKDRYINALRQHIGDADVIVGSSQNLRLAEGWLNADRPDDNSFDESPLRTTREVGPGGVLAIGYGGKSQYAVTNKGSQMPAEAENISMPNPKGSEPLLPTKLTVNLPPKAPKPMEVPNKGTMNEGITINLKTVESAKERKAKATGDIRPAIKEDINDKLDAIVADISIPANSPLKIAAVKAKNAKDLAQSAREMGVPQEEITKQQRELVLNLEKVTKIQAQQAQVEAKVAEQQSARPQNQLIWDVSLAKAEAHQKRLISGKDYHESAAQAAKELGIFDKKDPYKSALAKIKDASMKLLPSEDTAYSLSPAFKDIFVDPKAVELVKQEARSEPPKQPILPLSTEELLGSDLPVKPLTVTIGKPTQVKAQRRSKAPVVPAEVEALAAHSPSPLEVHVQPRAAEIAEQYKTSRASHDKKSTRDLTSETVELGKTLNEESPDLFQDVEEFGDPDQEVAARAGKTPMPDKAKEQAKVGGRGGGKKPPKNKDPFSGSDWDSKRDFAMSFGGDVQSLARRLDYGLKTLAKLHDPSANAAHPLLMAKTFIQKRSESIYVGDEIKSLLQKLYPAEVDKQGNWKNTDQLARHQAMAKAIGGHDEETRQGAMRSLPAQDQSIANMLDAYHQVVGKLGARVETHLWDEAQDHYFPRRVLFDENKQAVTPNVHGNTRMSTKMDIARKRRKQEVPTGLDEEGNPIMKTENYYKGNEDLKSYGFKVEEDISKLWGHHWDAYSNMNLTHQFIQLLSTLHDFKETNKGLQGIPKGSAPFVGRVLIPATESVGGKMRATQIGNDMRSQTTNVTKGPWVRALANYHVYKPIAEELERMASVRQGDNVAERTANALNEANGVWKVFKFAFNPIHYYNLMSNVYALGTKGLLDPAMYNPGFKVKGATSPMYTSSLHHRIFGRVDALLQDAETYKNWDNSEILGKDMIAKIMGWGGVLPKEIIDVASLGGITGVLARNVPGFEQWHNFMWHKTAWQGQVGLTLHMMDVMRAKFEKETGSPPNEAEFENLGRLATQQAKYAMGFLSREDMSRDWRVYASSLFLANSWSLSQARQFGMVLPKQLPGAKYLANLGGGETFNEHVTNQMESLGGMNQSGLDAINSYQANMARRMMLGGSAKLLASATILTYLGSYFGNQGQSQGPWENFQRDPTHVFDIYLGTDPDTHKDRWAHNPTFGMQQEMVLYMLEAMREYKRGGNPYDMLMGTLGRISNKANPLLSTSLDIAVNRNLSLYMLGFGDRSALDKDPQVIAIRRALDATGMNPFPDSFTNNLIYAIRTVFPSPGYPDTLNTQHGTNPNMTNATLGNTLNALGPGKIANAGDLINAIQSGDFSTLAKQDLGGLAMWLTGSRIATSSTPEAIATQNQIDSSIATKDQKNQALGDLSQAAQAGDWKSVGQMAQELGLSNSELISALEHPPSGVNAGPGIIYNGLPSKSGVQPAPQDTLMGQVLTPAQTTELETLKEVHTIGALKQITSLPEFQSGDQTTRTAMLASYTSLVDGMVNDMYAQNIGLLGGTEITSADIQATLNTAVEFRGVSEEVLSQLDSYMQASPLERQRMDVTYGQYAITLAKNAYNGNLRDVPLDNIRQILSYTITTAETTKSYLENSMFYQLAGPDDQNRMMNEYSSLAREMAKREALQQGQGNYAFRIPPEKMLPTIEFIMNVEETAKSALHGTDYYNSETPDVQKSLNLKYETLARGLAFSTSNADPRTLIQNSLNADAQYYGLQNEFGGSGYIKLMATQLSQLERNVRMSAEYTPKQINALQRAVRTAFLTQNPAYAAWLKARTDWQKYTANGQIYQAINNSEYAAVDDMQSAGVISDNSILLSGTNIDDNYMDPSAPMGLPPVDYDTFAAQNS